MKLEKKKELVSRALGIGKGRIRFNNERLSEVKEAITNQDMKDLLESGAIYILPGRGRKAVVRRTRRRTTGKVRMRVVDKKRRYMTLTRKFRKFIAVLRNQSKISEEVYQKIRKEIKASAFKDTNHLKERITQLTTQ